MENNEYQLAYAVLSGVSIFQSVLLIFRSTKI